MKRWMTWGIVASMAMLGLPSPLWALVVGPLGTKSEQVEDQVTDGKRTGAQNQVAHQASLQNAVQASQQAKTQVQASSTPRPAVAPARAAVAGSLAHVGGGGFFDPSNTLDVRFDRVFHQFIRKNWGFGARFPAKARIDGIVGWLKNMAQMAGGYVAVYMDGRNLVLDPVGIGVRIVIEKGDGLNVNVHVVQSNERTLHLYGLHDGRWWSARIGL